MRNFVKNWDFKKHVAAETMFYTSIAMIGNAFFKKPAETKSNCPMTVCRNMPKKQRIFNGILFGCFLIDMTAGYCLLKKLKKFAGQ